MTEEIIIAGFGGQGVLSMGKILAYSGVMQGQEVTWFPSYGPEMRGGTANVTVILSDNRISSPILHEFDTAIILNRITSYNVCYTKLLRFGPEKGSVHRVAEKVKAVITSYSIHYTKLYETALITHFGMPKKRSGR